MKSLPLAALGVAACAAATARPPVIAGAEPLRDASGTVWLVGVAGNAKAGAMLQVGDAVVLCDDRPGWPADVAGLPLVVAGTLTRRTLPPLPIGPNGERSAGAEGQEVALRRCSFPAAEHDDTLLAAEQRVFAAIARRDAPALARLIGGDFVLRTPGQPDTSRAAFLDGLAAIPGDIIAVEGESLVTHRAGDVGIVRGVQIARLRTAGQVIADRQSFVDVFARHGDAWVMTFALSAPLAP